MNLRTRLHKLEAAAGREPAEAPGERLTDEERQRAYDWLNQRVEGNWNFAARWFQERVAEIWNATPQEVAAHYGTPPSNPPEAP